jgi:Tol biopolymer transport system component
VNKPRAFLFTFAAAAITFPICCPVSAADTVGTFEGHADVGITPRAGSAEFNSATNEYRLTGGGANVWAAEDAFQFAWRRLSGDVTITADIQFIGAGAVAHRKAMLMVRQDLTAGSGYADVSLHGDGLTSLQHRPTPGAQTLEIQSTEKGPVRIRIERLGNQFTMYAGKPGGQLTASAPATVVLEDPVYVGIGVCSHDANILETAVFSNLQITPAAQPARARQPRYKSAITIYDVATKTSKVLYTADTVWEAPNWSMDGKYLLANSGGKIYRLPVNGTGPVTPEKLDMDATLNTNNDHGPSWNGKMIAFSASSPTARQSQVYVADADGRNARLITPKSPSYFHGWSPDDKWLTFVAARGDQNYDIFRVPAAGGEEQRLTASAGYDDGSEYSPDGKWIYFNSDRSGGWNIWRIPPDGAGPNDAKAQMVTNDEAEDWFPHVSPNGRKIVFLSFPPGTKDHNGKMDIQLRMMDAPGATIKPAKIETVTKIFGGQGTINVNSWSPDSKKFAYVVFELLP